MKSLAFLILGLSLSAAPAATKFLINEVHVNPPGTINATDGDGNYEFIEIISVDSVTGQPIANQPCTGLTLLVVDTSGGTAGEVNEAWSLHNFSTGANGILMLGDGYDNIPIGGPWFNYLSGQTTAVADPIGMGGDNLGDNPGSGAGFTLLLVSNFTGIADPGAGLSGTDVDSNDDRVLGPYIVDPQVSVITTTTPPWTAIIDSVGVPERRTGGAASRDTYATAKLSAGTPAAAASQWDVSSFARKLNANSSSNLLSTSAAWYGGEIKGTLSAIAYNPAATSPVHYFGLLNAGGTNAPGEATPGQPNLIIAPAEAAIRINEVSINPAGSDRNYEYVELISTNRPSASLSGYHLLLVDSSTVAGGVFVLDGNGVIISTIIPHSSVGEVLEAWSLDGLTTGTNSLCLIGNNYSAKFTPFGTYVSPQTIIGSPDGMGNSDLVDESAFSLLLVKDLPVAVVARVGNTPGTDLDANDDGGIDAATFGMAGTTPVDIRDSIGYDQVIGGAYATSVGKSYSAMAKITMPAFQIMDNVSRKSGTSTISATNWYGGQYGGRQGISLGFRTAPFFGSFVGSGTPGQPNFNAAPATATDIRLNEVHFGPAGSTGGVGYVEIASTTEKITTANNLHLLIIDNAPPSVGTIEAVVDLRGISTGVNGVGIFGDGAEEPNFPWNAAIPPTSTRDDPQSFNTDGSENTVLNIGPSTLAPNNGKTVLLVAGFTGAKNDDLDTNDDATFEVLPWTLIVDSISSGPATHAGIANIGIQGYQVGNLSRYPGQLTANNLPSWYFGQMSGAANDQAQTAYTANYNGAFKGSASPGRPNHKAEFSSGNVLINEVNINPPGGDNNKEFIELISTTGVAQSMNGWSLLLIDSSSGSNNTGNVGNIVEAWSLDGLSTGSNGLALLGDGYTSGSIPYTAALAPSPLTALGDPLGLDAEDIGREGDNGALSLLLVKDFTGNVADDIDTVGDYTLPAQSTPPGDGVVDITPIPWSSITDSIGIKYWNAVASRLEGIIYGSVDKSQTGYTPDNLSRQRGFLTPNSGTSWYGGDIVAGGNDTIHDAVQKFPAGFAGKVTPGRNNIGTNAWDTLDDDGDTVKNIIEDATNMNVNQSDVSRLPETGMLNVSGTDYPTFTYTQIKNTTDFQYAVETSTNLQTWTTGNTVQVSATDSQDGATTIIVLRPSNAYFAALVGPTPKVFMRLRVTRL